MYLSLIYQTAVMKKILIIDDDDDLTDIVSRILVQADFHAHIHPNGLNVPDVVKHYNPDLILLDIRLYRESGTDICRELKRRYHMPILLFSADTKQGEAFADCGADGFLSKPFDTHDLLHIVDLHINPSKEIA